MKAISCLVSVIVVVSLLTCSVARGDANVVHVSTMKPYCSGKGYCARMSNGERTSMLPAYTITPVKFNEVDGEPIY
jgi:hypothetical protein